MKSDIITIAIELDRDRNILGVRAFKEKRVIRTKKATSIEVAHCMRDRQVVTDLGTKFIITPSIQISPRNCK